MKKIIAIIAVISIVSCSKNKDLPTDGSTTTESGQKMLYSVGDSTYMYDITNKKPIWSSRSIPANILIDSKAMFSTTSAMVFSTDLTPKANNLWIAHTGAQGYNPGPSVVWPVGNDSIIYVSGDFSASVFAIRKNNGTTKWKTDLKLPTGGTPSATVNPVLNNDKIIISGQNKIFCLNSLNGNILWSYTTDAAGGESVADCVVDNRVYHLGHMGYVYCLDIAGSLLWKQKVSTYPLYDFDNITVKNNVVYLFSSIQQTAVNALNGSVIWQKPYKSSIYSTCYSNDKIYSSYGRILIESASTGDSLGAIVPVPFRIAYYQVGEPVYEKAFHNTSVTSDKIISELVISGSLAKDTLFIFDKKDLSVYDKIILSGKVLRFPPLIIENGTIRYPVRSGNEN